jgi:hypothetical protein
VVDRGNAALDKYKSPDQKTKPDPFEQHKSDPNKTR